MLEVLGKVEGEGSISWEGGLEEGREGYLRSAVLSPGAFFEQPVS